MAYSSGEFSAPGVTNRPAPGAVAVFDDYLWLIGCGSSSGPMYWTKLALTHEKENEEKPIDIENGDVETPANWSSGRLSIPGIDAHTTARCAATALLDGMYLVWSNDNVYASRYAATAKTPGWQKALTLYEQGGAHVLASSSNLDVSVTPIGTDRMIVACAGAPCWWNDNAPTLYVGTFLVEDIEPDKGTWPARSDTWIGWDRLKGPRTINGVGTRVSIDCYSGTSALNPLDPLLLWVSLSPDGLQGDTASVLLPVTSDGHVDLEGVPSLPFYVSKSSCDALRDPAGRMRTYASAPATHSLEVCTYNTYAAPDNSSPPAATPLPQTFSSISPATADGVPPSAIFYVDKGHPQAVTVNDRPGTGYPVYEFVFYNGANVRCQVSRYGTAELLPSYQQLSPEAPKDTTVVIPAGIIEGPIPIPNENIANVVIEDTQSNFGTLVYSSTAKTSKSHTVSSSTTIGIDSSGQVTKGTGEAWDISMSMGVAFLNTDESTESESEPHESEALIDTETIPPHPGPQKLLCAAGVVGCQAQINVDAYRFLDADGQPICDPTDSSVAQQAPLFVRTWAEFPDAPGHSYYPCVIRAGDITSYTPDEWNTRMAKLIGYEGDYFTNVIEANAYEFASGRKYLYASWDPNNTSTEAFEAIKDSFFEQSWMLDTSVYVGVSGGEGAEIFGFGENFEVKLLAGATFDMTIGSATETTTQWGIEIVPGSLAVPAVNDEHAVSSYAFRTYFLPVPQDPSPLPSNYWTKELKQCLAAAPPPEAINWNPLTADEIDPNGAAWKIVFVVTDYVYNKGSGKPEYHYKPPRPTLAGEAGSDRPLR